MQKLETFHRTSVPGCALRAQLCKLLAFAFAQCPHATRARLGAAPRAVASFTDVRFREIVVAFTRMQSLRWGV